MSGVALVPLVLALHTSSPTAGEREEVTQNVAAAGLELRIGDHMQVDAALGYKKTDCHFYQNCGTSPAGVIEIRWTGAPLWSRD